MYPQVEEIERTRKLLSECKSSATKTRLMGELHTKLMELKLPGQIATQQKDFYGSISRLGKVVEKYFAMPSFSNRETHLDEKLLNEVIASHFYREGQPELGQLFCEEAGVEVTEETKKAFLDMHTIVGEIERRNLVPALAWADRNSDRLSRQGSPSTSLEFKLHSMQFMHLLRSRGSKDALVYARANLSRFAESYMLEFRQLMGCLLYHNDIEKSPYKDLLSASHWEDVKQDFIRECCHLMGQSCESPLLVATAAGALAIPTLAKFTTVMAKQQQEWTAMEQLPVEIELGHDFTFYSIFACPISREWTSEPSMLPCGHVLSKLSVNKLSKGGTKQFKCPYCPQECDSRGALRITF